MAIIPLIRFVTMAIFSHQDIVSRSASLAVGATTEHTACDIHVVAILVFSIV